MKPIDIAWAIVYQDIQPIKRRRHPGCSLDGPSYSSMDGYDDIVKWMHDFHPQDECDAWVYAYAIAYRDASFERWIMENPSKHKCMMRPAPPNGSETYQQMKMRIQLNGNYRISGRRQTPTLEKYLNKRRRLLNQ